MTQPKVYSNSPIFFESFSFRPFPMKKTDRYKILIFIFFNISGENWAGVSFDEFSKCDSNLAINRQTRMLSDLALVGCYDKSSMPAHERDRIILASAKKNLASMSYFGLTEYQKVSSDRSYLSHDHICISFEK